MKESENRLKIEIKLKTIHKTTKATQSYGKTTIECRNHKKIPPIANIPIFYW